MPDLCQHFGLDQGELPTSIPTGPPVPLQTIVRLRCCPLDSFRCAMSLAYDVN
jgi:hypothetical protein